MKYFVVFFFLILSATAVAQEVEPSQKVSGIIVNDNTNLPLSSVNIININKVRGATSDANGYFEINVQPNDTLHFTILGFQSLRVRVTNDWIKNKTTRIRLTEKAIALEEVIIRPFNLTGYLEIDTKLIPTKENYRYSISGLTEGYEAGEYSPNAFGRVLGSIFNNLLITQSCKSSVLPGTVSTPAGLWITIKSSSRCIRCSVRKLLNVQFQADRENKPAIIESLPQNYNAQY